MALVRDLGKCSASRGVSLLGMVTKHSNSGSETKHTDIPQQSHDHLPTFISITRFDDQTFRIFLNGWIDCRNAFHAVLCFMILHNGLKMSEYEDFPLIISQVRVKK